MRTLALRILSMALLATPIAIAVSGVPTCPKPYPMCLKDYGAVGSKTFLCCKEDQMCTDTRLGNHCCKNYYLQKYVCDNDPGQPTAYGYHVTTDELYNGNCTGGQGACY